MKRTLNVIAIHPFKVAEIWNCHPTYIKGWGDKFVYARCNSEGEVNWDKTLVYSQSEIIGRKICIKAFVN